MLFPYTYVPHSMEKMQTFIDFIFYKVWCKAPTSGAFSTDLFIENTNLHEIMLAFQWGDTAGGDFFYSHVERIYDSFAALNDAQINQFRQWYQGNNEINKVCANDSAIELVRYADITVLHKELSEHLANFFKGLYSQKLLGLTALREKIGDIDDHYYAFMEVNKSGKCPFCGIVDMQGIYHTTREAYDHYFPKGLYPFNSINFRNLVPACHHCNSSYKTSKDPAFAPKDPARSAQRRKVFYPYSNSTYEIELKIEINYTDLDHLKPEHLEMEFGPSALIEEIETWKDVYGIEERYKAKCCSADGKYWLAQVFDEWEVNGTPENFLKTLARHTLMNPYAECNFLKKAFLDACEKNGLLEAET